MSGALDRVAQALAGASEDEVGVALSAAGISVPRPSVPSAPLRTPLPGPEASLHIVSEVEWV
ncbi:hypothetical protein CW362_22730 [Streptomyces populi]|uniref:Uncharacterized protein n=1 Tax=Streptomyces populi TaxID=2058924 RepID=A0A2I0SLE8_9ACTN|nr:hypothetical protein CW362_22730 [Streptomyces populi]